jgi:BirA family biotin operon repressor/biotin-[acetyl-CoA-carboxylase] ligase
MTATEQNFKLIELDKVDSTNNHAMYLIRENRAENGTVVLARHQTEGKGQRGKSWKDNAGESINCSLIIKPAQYNIHQVFDLIARTACAIRKVIEATIRHPVHIKWPNDIYVNDRKAAGILIECITRGNEWQWAVIGFGINVNQHEFPEELPNPISLKQLTGKTYDIKRLAEDCLNILLRDLSNKDFSEILNSYNKHLYKLNQEVTLQFNEQLITTTLAGVDETGSLLVNGNQHASFRPGEVFLVR